MKSKLYSSIFGLTLLGFSIYVLLDTFVFSEVYEKVDTTVKSMENGTGEVTATENYYQDDNIMINISEIRKYDTTVYIADIILNNSDYLKTAFAKDTYGKNITATTSDTAISHNAILAINGDYYGVQKNGYVLKNYKLYRSLSAGDKEDLIIYGNGTFEIINENDISAEELVKKGVKELLSFGPALIMDGEIVVSKNDEVGKAMAGNPRSAIGLIDSNHYVFVVSDGRTNDSFGLSLYELASVMKEYGVNTLYNLDGGGSSSMFFNGKIINNPTTNGKTIKEREVSDIVYIGY